MKSEWRIMKFSDIVEFNPKESIPKGTISKKIGMDKLHLFCRDITEYEIAEYTGGCKFRNGDTIMARITPCLENGKTSKVNILNDDEVGFGSTEYIVFRAKSGITDPDYIYYLVCSPSVREPAIKSMVGSSGRQRVQTDVIQRLEFAVPSLEEQVKIGSVPKALDDKIAVNVAINDNLADLLQVIYKQHFACMNVELIDGCLADICEYSSGRIAVSDLSLDNYYSTENMLPGKIGAVQATSLPTITQTTKCKSGDVLISNIRPYFKKIVYCHDECGCSTDVLCFTPKQQKYSAFLFSTLYDDRFFDYTVAGSKGTKMPRGDKQQIMTFPLQKPSDKELNSFNEIANPILANIKNNRIENLRLSLLRDTLLPQLMTGKLDISEISI